MRKFFIAGLLVYMAFTAGAQDTAIVPGAKKDRFGEGVLLPNGWSLTPAGHSLTLGDLPLNIAVSPSGRYLAVTIALSFY
jgi:hypothetical protein